jgi:RNA polymerase sigma-70 factor (ECF subfamily)
LFSLAATLVADEYETDRSENKMIKPQKDLDPSIETCTTDLSDPVFLSDLRLQMLKFAVLQLSDVSLAEDAVQEALVGALKNTGSFGRRAAFKTWVFAILKHKITDIFRQRKKLVYNSELSPNDDDDFGDQLFGAAGRWEKDARPVKWSNPLESVKTDHFWKVFDACLNNLPETQARIFMMREFLELDSSEICETQDITTSNLHVILYRSRLRLRKCLETNWFLEGDKL